MSVGAELSYRKNMPLLSDPVNVLPPAFSVLVPGSIATTAVPTEGTPGALGDTWHGLINALSVLPRTALFDTATIAGELTWMQWSKVTQNEAVFKGRSNYTQIDKPTRNFFGLAINFTPTWFQVWPGVDLLAPLTWNQGISGNSAVAFGGSRDGGNLERGSRCRHLPEVSDRSEVQRLLRKLLDHSDGRHACRGASWACPTGPTRRCPIGAGSRSRSRRRSDLFNPDHRPRRTLIMFRKTLLAAGFAALFSTGALAAVRPMRRSSSARR